MNIISNLGWTREQIIETRFRLQTFEEDWNTPDMEMYDEESGDCPHDPVERNLPPSLLKITAGGHNETCLMIRAKQEKNC